MHARIAGVRVGRKKGQEQISSLLKKSAAGESVMSRKYETLCRNHNENDREQKENLSCRVKDDLI